jgi:D-ribose pyranose/furanose isomerase RbsD
LKIEDYAGDGRICHPPAKQLMPTIIRYVYLPLVILMAGCAGNSQQTQPWMGSLRHELNYLGARNWIVVVEAAFPIQSRRGLRVIRIEGDIPDVVDAVEQVIEEKHHVKPRIYVTSEIGSVPYDYAPGIKNYRKELKEALHGRETVQLDNAMLMRLLNDTSKTYRVLVIKTRTALPYSSVFMELGSGYWDAESESALREGMEKKRQ